MKYLNQANEVKFKDAVDPVELRKEIVEFRDKWNFTNVDLVNIFDTPMGTVAGIIAPSKAKTYVMPYTASKIRKAIRNYDPRSCRYRRLDKADVAKTLYQIKNKHNWTWDQMSEVLGYPKNKLWQIVSPASEKKYVHIETVRDMLVNYNDSLKKRAEILKREHIG